MRTGFEEVYQKQIDDMIDAEMNRLDDNFVDWAYQMGYSSEENPVTKETVRLMKFSWWADYRKYRFSTILDELLNK